MQVVGHTKPAIVLSMFCALLIGSSSPAQNMANSHAVPDLFRARACRSNSHKCRAVCEAANTLKSAALDLALCAAKYDYSNDCSVQAMDSKDASDNYESAVSDAEDDCD
jgi:hypothetical protein